jgi:hypothetical protein
MLTTVVLGPKAARIRGRQGVLGLEQGVEVRLVGREGRRVVEGEAQTGPLSKDVLGGTLPFAFQRTTPLVTGASVLNSRAAFSSSGTKPKPFTNFSMPLLMGVLLFSLHRDYWGATG